MRRRPTRARATIAPALAPQSPPTVIGGLLSTSTSSPSTSVSLGIGSFAAIVDDGSLKTVVVEAPRCSVRLAGAASSDTPCCPLQTVSALRLASAGRGTRGLVSPPVLLSLLPGMVGIWVAVAVRLALWAAPPTASVFGGRA
ncbi:hypothetical protein ZWY2020_046282 [Hordeum vulgare]|nr:hypothetical protein ZWY2020_046282 [Hordeum vulgare]